MSETFSFVRQSDSPPKVEQSVGSLGSVVVTVSDAPPVAITRAVDELSDRFRKVWYDLRGGMAVFMAPSRAHEMSSVDSADLVIALCQCRDVPVVRLRSATTGGKNEGGAADPDESFFIGEKAAEFLKIQRGEGRDAALERTENVPPDLVIEVEHTHRAEHKRGLYREFGVGELWELATTLTNREPAIYDLQACAAPTSVPTSSVVPGTRAECIEQALEELRQMGGRDEFMLGLGRGEPLGERLLEAAGVPVAPDLTPPPASPSP